MASVALHRRHAPPLPPDRRHREVLDRPLDRRPRHARHRHRSRPAAPEVGRLPVLGRAGRNRAGLPARLGAFGGLGVALILAVYDYLGYYNICYLAEEVKEPTKTIPRVIVVSILSVAVLYVLMNVSILSVLPAKEAMTSKSTVSDFVAAVAGRPMARAVTVLILWTAFASVFSLTLGYSRILWAAARDGNFFRLFARLHPTEGYPVVALFALGGAAALFSFIDLRKVVMAILSIRAVIPFMAQIVAALVLRRRLPDSARPFRMWLYPLPALVALLLWGFVLFSPEKGLRATGLVVIGAGTIAFLVRSRLRGTWPFAPAGPPSGANIRPPS